MNSSLFSLTHAESSHNFAQMIGHSGRVDYMLETSMMTGSGRLVPVIENLL